MKLSLVHVNGTLLVASCILVHHTSSAHSAALFDFTGDAASSSELSSSFPTVSSSATDSSRPGKNQILCPFLRLVERSGTLDASVTSSDTGDLLIANSDLKPATDEFGCDTTTACGPVIDAVSLSQNLSELQNGGSTGTLTGLWNWFTGAMNQQTAPPAEVDLFRLWDAPGISHACGLTFDTPGTSVSATKLQSTLAALKTKSDANSGHLVYQDILDAKLGICANEQVDISSAGQVETKLIYAYLGGVDRGFIDYSDVVQFLSVNNTVPVTKASKPITAFYLLQVN